MKKHYAILLYVFAAEMIAVLIMSAMNVTAQSWLGNAIGTLLILLPVEILLFLLGRDKDVSKNKRLCATIGFWFIALCYCLGGVLTLIEKG